MLHGYFPPLREQRYAPIFRSLPCDISVLPCWVHVKFSSPGRVLFGSACGIEVDHGVQPPLTKPCHSKIDTLTLPVPACARSRQLPELTRSEVQTSDPEKEALQSTVTAITELDLFRGHNKQEGKEREGFLELKQ